VSLRGGQLLHRGGGVRRGEDERRSPQLQYITVWQTARSCPISIISTSDEFINKCLQNNHA